MPTRGTKLETAALTWTNATAVIASASADVAVTATTVTEGDRGLPATTAGITTMGGMALVVADFVNVAANGTVEGKLLRTRDGTTTEVSRFKVSGTNTASGLKVGAIEVEAGDVYTLGVSNETDGDDCTDFDAYLEIVMLACDTSEGRSPIAR